MGLDLTQALGLDFARIFGDKGITKCNKSRGRNLHASNL